MKQQPQHATRITQARNTQCVLSVVFCVLLECFFFFVCSDCKIQNKKQDTREITTERCRIIFAIIWIYDSLFFYLSSIFNNVILKELKTIVIINFLHLLERLQENKIQTGQLDVMQTSVL